MSYDSEVLADSPWIYLKTDEASGTIADSSGNGRDLTLPAGSPTYAQSGPAGASDALSWPDSAGATEYYGVTSATLGSATESIECWFYLTATPTNDTPLVGHGTWNNTGVRGFVAFIGTDGKMKLWVGDSSTTTVFTSASAVGLNAWHHMVATVSGTNSKVRLDKTDVVTGTGQAFTAAALTFLLRGGGNRPATANLTNGSVVKVSKAASYSTALSNTRIDAHYNAMFPSGDATVSAVAATATASATAPTLSGSANVTAPVATATAAANAPTLVTDADAAVSVPAATATAEALPPTLSWDANLAATSATATADALAPTVTAHAAIAAPAATATAAAEPPDIDNGSGNHTVTAPVATATATAHAPVFTANYEVGTDTTNTFTGLDLTARGTVTITYPAATPTVDLGTRVDAALPYPQPVMDNGRPT